MAERVPRTGSAGFLLMHLVRSIFLAAFPKRTLVLGPMDLKPSRSKPLKIKWRNYCFRAKIYQAVNLPAKDCAYDEKSFKKKENSQRFQ